MSRVMKKFLKKLAGPIGFMAYIMFAVSLTTWTIINVSEAIAIAVFIIMIPIPAITFLIRDMWRDAKREVEWENDYMLNTLKEK